MTVHSGYNSSKLLVHNLERPIPKYKILSNYSPYLNAQLLFIYLTPEELLRTFQEVQAQPWVFEWIYYSYLPLSEDICYCSLEPSWISSEVWYFLTEAFEKLSQEQTNSLMRVGTFMPISIRSILHSLCMDTSKCCKCCTCATNVKRSYTIWDLTSVKLDGAASWLVNGVAGAFFTTLKRCYCIIIDTKGDDADYLPLTSHVISASNETHHKAEQ